MIDCSIGLSVIIPCYNYDKFVAQAIESVISQKRADLEIIVVDDGSVDDSWRVITSFGDGITAVRSENQGALRSSLLGFSKSKGRFVYFLDADDYLNEGAIDCIFRNINDDVSKIQFMLLPVDVSGNKIGVPFPQISTDDNSSSMAMSIALRGYYLTPPTSGNVFRRDVFERVLSELSNMSYERAIDGVGLLLAPFLGRVISIAEPLACYRVHFASLSDFSNITADRLEGYSNRFIGRLDHLDRILANSGLPMLQRYDLDQFSYIQEMKILGAILSGKKPSFTSLRRYIAATFREHPIRKAFLLTAIIIIIFMFPSRLAKTVIEFKISQAKYPKLRSLLKSILRVLSFRLP